jgi:hypothetical protein
MRFALRLAALSAALVNLAAAPPSDPLAGLAVANGHPAAVHFRATASRVVEGRTVTTTFDQLGATELVERCIAGVCGGLWFDGTRSWTFGLNEVVLPEAVDDATRLRRTLAAIASYAFAEPAFRAAGGSAGPAGPNRWRVRAPGGAELIAIADPTTQSITRVETGDGTPVALYRRERKVNGATFALDRDDADGIGPLENVAGMPGPLGPPVGELPAFGTPSPLTLAAEPIPIVPCTVGGRRARCLIDSGTTPSAVTLALAEALKLEPHGEIEVSGFSRFATGFIETGPFDLGPAHFARTRFAVVPGTNALHFDAIVGSDLLGRLRVVFDRRLGTASILPPGGASAANAIPLIFRSGSPMLAAQLGSEPVSALLDTGDDAVLSIGYALYRQGPQWPLIARGVATGLAGAADDFTVDVPAVHIGSLVLGPTRTVVRRTQVEPHVGIGLWTRSIIDLDEQAERIRFDSR